MWVSTGGRLTKGQWINSLGGLFGIENVVCPIYFCFLAWFLFSMLSLGLHRLREKQKERLM